MELYGFCGEDFLGGVKDRSSAPREHERETSCHFEGLKAERMEGFLGGFRNSFLILGKPEMGVLCVCVIARREKKVNKRGSERGRKENSGFLLVTIPAFELLACRDGLPIFASTIHLLSPALTSG